MNTFSYKKSSVLLVMVPTLIFGFWGRPTEMTISLVAGFTAAVLLNIDKFESFKAGQLEATLKKSEKIIDDANATIEQLNSVLIPLLKSNLASLLYEGTFDGMPPEVREINLFELLKIKNSFNLTELDENFTETAKEISSHYFSNIFREVAARDDGFRIKYEKYTMSDCAPETPTVSEIESFFAENPNLLTQDAQKALDKIKIIKQEFLIE